MAPDRNVRRDDAASAMGASSMTVVNDSGCGMTFWVDWEGGESGASPHFDANSETIVFANQPGLKNGTGVWPTIEPDGGPVDHSGALCIVHTSSSVVATYCVTGDCGNLTLSGPNP